MDTFDITVLDPKLDFDENTEEFDEEAEEKDEDLILSDDDFSEEIGPIDDEDNDEPDMELGDEEEM